MRRLVLALALALCAACGVTSKRPVLVEKDRSFRLELTGNDAFSRGTLLRLVRHELDDFEAKGYRKSDIDDAAYLIQRHYRGAGFPDAVVDYEFEGPQGDEITASITVKEGPRCELRRVRVEGATAFDESQLVALVVKPSSDLFSLGTTYYVERELLDGVASMETLYYDHGYRAIVIEDPVVRFSDDRRQARVNIRVVEGPCTRLQTFSLDLEDEELAAALHERLQPFIGQAYHDRLPFEMRARAIETLTQMGYAEAEVDPEVQVDLPNEVAVARVRLTVRPGPKVHLNRIYVRGLDRTNKRFALRRADLDPGDVYDSRAVRRAFRRLYATGLFRRIDMALVGDDPEGLRDVLIEVDEQPASEFWVEPGYGAWELWRVRAGYRDRNLFGRGLVLDVEGKVAVRARGASISIAEPQLFGYDLRGDITLFTGEREEPSFTEIETGIRTSVTRQLTENTHFVTGYQFKDTDLKDVEVGSATQDEQDVDVATIFLGPTYDTRDRLLLTRRGQQIHTRIEFAEDTWGSQINFVRGEYFHSLYFALAEQTVLAGSLRTGVIAPYGLTDMIPLQERFFNGGDNTVRSYKQDELGPKDANGEPIGGETYTVVSTELRQKLTGALWGALFFDIGNVSEDHTDYFKFEDLGSAVGTGLRYHLPVGAIRLDFGVNPDPAEDEEDYALHLTIGMSF